MSRSPQGDGLHDLLLRVATGDEAAFEILCTQWYDRIGGYLRSTFSSLTKEDVEDIVQDIFLTIWCKAKQYRGSHNDVSAKKWIFTIARNRAIRALEIAKRIDQKTQFLDVEDEHSHPARRSATKRELEQEVFTHLRCGDILANLSERERKIVNMRFHGYTLAEIGKVLGVSKERIHEILKTIKRRAQNL